MYSENEQVILQRMADKQGLTSVVGTNNYNMNSSFAIELAEIKNNQDEIVYKSNIITAFENGYDDTVIRYASEDGVDLKPALPSNGVETFYGTEGTVIPVGFQFGNEANGLLYETVLEGTINANGEVNILSVSTGKGAKYNKEANTLTYMPVKLVGVTSCTNKNPFTDGADEESIEDLYYRHQKKVRENPNGVNRTQYELWALERPNVGSAKCYPLKDENLQYKKGHICLVITNSERKKADEDLCNDVLDYINPRDGSEGVGSDLATLHVISAIEKILNLKFTLTYDSTYDLETVKNNIINEITSYLKNLDTDVSKISYSKIGSLIYKANGVKEYDDLLINDDTKNIILLENEVAVLGEVIIND